MNDWLAGLRALGERGKPAALVTVIQARGSTPREPGARMTVGPDATWDSIGGGQLEHAAIESARLLLEEGDESYVNTIERHELGPSLGQCCGGVATLLVERIPADAAWPGILEAAGRDNAAAVIATAIGGAKHAVRQGDDMQDSAIEPLVCRAMDTGKPVLDKTADGTRWLVEPVPPPDFHIVLFGAGHVGSALAGVLATLPAELTWVDPRAGQFPESPPADARIKIMREPELLVDDCPAGAYYLVMTHSHPLDLAICERILKRGDFAYCGLIGSASKRRNFAKRLRLKGITESTLNRLTCPIGVDGISGKRPAEIAVAAAAEVLQVREGIQTGRKADLSLKVEQSPGSTGTGE